MNLFMCDLKKRGKLLVEEGDFRTQSEKIQKISEKPRISRSF